MSSTTTLQPQSNPPTVAGPVGRLFHTAVAVVGWLLFGYWWWLVFQRVTRAEVQFTLLFIAFALAIIVLLTAIWALHNLRIFRMRGPRTQIRRVARDFARDGIGRAVAFPAASEECRTSPVVHVRLENGTKTYLATGVGAPPADAGKRP